LGAFLRRLPVHLDPEDDLFRWVHREHHQNGTLKPGAFIMKKKDKDGLSVGIATLTTRSDFNDRAEPNFTASVVLKVHLPSDKGLRVIHDGIGHPSHGVITGFQIGFSNKQLVDMERDFIDACAGTLQEIVR
jgi:hypothetical protein